MTTEAIRAQKFVGSFFGQLLWLQCEMLFPHVMVYASNLNTWETELGRPLSLRTILHITDYILVILLMEHFYSFDPGSFIEHGINV